MKLTIEIDYDLKELKEKYRQFFGIPKGDKITKAMIANWLGGLAESDIEDVGGDDEEE